MTRQYDRPAMALGHNKLARAVVVGGLVVATALGIAKGFGEALQNISHPGYTISADEFRSGKWANNELVVTPDKYNPAVELGKLYTKSGVLVFITADGGKDWTERTDLEKGTLISDEFANGGYHGDPVDGAFTTVAKDGTVTTTLEEITQQGVKTIAQTSVKNAGTIAMADELAHGTQPVVQTEFTYGEYNERVANVNGIATRPDHYNEQVLDVNGNVIANMQLTVPGPQIIPGTEL